jgi:biopolymer transport protein TolR
MELGRRENGDRGTMSQINVTPLVDVMLVLLIIFMVTAPMMQQGMQVNLPKEPQLKR